MNKQIEVIIKDRKQDANGNPVYRLKFFDYETNKNLTNEFMNTNEFYQKTKTLKDGCINFQSYSLESQLMKIAKTLFGTKELIIISNGHRY